LIFSENQHDGVLITFTGLDGSGKTTQIDLLAKALADYGITVIVTKQPSDAMRNSHIFRAFHDNEDTANLEYRALSLLAVSDRILHSEMHIKPSLDKKCVVICDRYYYCALANLRARGYRDDQWIYEISKYLPKPDLSVILDVEVDTAIDRIRQRELERNKWIDKDFYNKLSEEYRNLRSVSDSVFFDNQKSIDDIHKVILNLSNELIKRKLER